MLTKHMTGVTPMRPFGHILTISLLIGSLCGCAQTPDACNGKDVYIGMAADQALPILQQCGKLSAQATGGITSWVFRDRVISVAPKGVMMIVNLK
jgi:hypothetical protein